MLALTLSTSELRLPTLSVVKDNRSWDRDQGTLTQEEYTSEKWGSYFPYEIQRCWSPDENAAGLLGYEGPLGSFKFILAAAVLPTGHTAL